MLKKSEIKPGVILCWGIDHPINKFSIDYWSVLEVGELSFKIELLGGVNEVKEIHFDSEFFSRMKISNSEEVFLSFVKMEKKFAEERIAKKRELEEFESKYQEFHEKVMEFKRRFKPNSNLASQAA
ncbi:MAG: hypothetical protein ABSE68_00060 [Minisyncoccia bacterium]